MLGSGASIDSRNEDGCTALHFAADRGQREVARLLIQHGADVNAVDSDGQTPLHYAALCQQQQVMSASSLYRVSQWAQTCYEACILCLVKMATYTTINTA